MHLVLQDSELNDLRKTIEMLKHQSGITLRGEMLSPPIARRDSSVSKYPALSTFYFPWNIWIMRSSLQEDSDEWNFMQPVTTAISKYFIYSLIAHE